MLTTRCPQKTETIQALLKQNPNVLRRRKPNRAAAVETVTVMVIGQPASV
jgi:hypothetical protein